MIKRLKWWVADLAANVGLFALGLLLHALSEPEEPQEPTGYLG